jgi:hypothetical protein
MKKLLPITLAILTFILPHESSAQRRLLASSVNYANGTFDSARYYYSGNRGGAYYDATADILPQQMVQRDGSLPLKYDSALVWFGHVIGTVRTLTARYTNTFDAADKVVATTIRKFSVATVNKGEVYTYNSAGLQSVIGYIDSVATWPSMTPNYFKSSTYNSSNQPLNDTFYYARISRRADFNIDTTAPGKKWMSSNSICVLPMKLLTARILNGTRTVCCKRNNTLTSIAALHTQVCSIRLAMLATTRITHIAATTNTTMAAMAGSLSGLP